jgi:hypothetical protein
MTESRPPKRGGRKGNRNAAKFPEPTKRLHARIPSSLHDWAHAQGNASEVVAEALREKRERESLSLTPVLGSRA